MADNKQEPQFLGGGPKFNRAGAQPPDEEASESPPAAPAFRMRNLLIALVALLLIGLLYWITAGPNGTTHVTSHGGTSPDKRPTAPDSDSGPSNP